MSFKLKQEECAAKHGQVAHATTTRASRPCYLDTGILTGFWHKTRNFAFGFPIKPATIILMAWAFLATAYLITAIAYFSIFWRAQRATTLIADLAPSQLREASPPRRS